MIEDNNSDGKTVHRFEKGQTSEMRANIHGEEWSREHTTRTERRSTADVIQTFMESQGV